MIETQLPVIIALLLLSGFFSGTEAAFFSLDRLQLRKLERDGRPSSAKILQILARPSSFLTAVLIGNNLVNIALSVLTTSLCLRLFGDLGLQISILATTVAVLLVGEVTPKSIAVNFPERVSRIVVRPVLFLQVVFSPLVAVFTVVSEAFLKMLGLESGNVPSSRMISRGELGTILEGADQEGVMTAQESELVNNILEFSTTRAEEVMTPRIDMVAASLEMDREELEALAVQSKHSRIPIYQNTIDEITGYMPTRELLLHPETKPGELVRDIAIFPERAFVSQVFYETQKSRTPLSIVVNEFGETVGLLTQEDLLEELVGELYDEFEAREEPIQPLGGGHFLVSGKVNLEEINAALGVEIPDEDALTLNGFLSGLYGGIPPAGAIIPWNGLRFVIEEASRHRILTCRIEVIPENGSGEPYLREVRGDDG